MKYCILLAFHMNIKCINVFQTSPFCPYCVPDIATLSYQTHGFHLLITSWHILPVHHFTLAPFFAFSLICLSYINKSFVMKMSYLFPARTCYELPSSWSGITSFPVKTLNCHISQNRHTRIPVFALNWDLVTSILYTKNRTISSYGNFAYRAIICAVWSSRGEEGNCSYLLPLSHRATGHPKVLSVVRRNVVSCIARGTDWISSCLVSQSAFLDKMIIYHQSPC